MNITRASIITHSACTHNRLVHSGRAIECDLPGSIGKSRHDYRSSAVLQRDQYLAIIKLTFVAADELMLKIDWPLASRGDLAHKRKTYLAVHANSLRLVRDALVRIGNLDHISGRKSYGCPGSRRIGERR